MCKLTNLTCSPKLHIVIEYTILYEGVLARDEAVATRTKQRKPKHPISHTYVHFGVKYLDTNQYWLSCGHNRYVIEKHLEEKSTYSYCLSGHFTHGGSLSVIYTYMHVRTLSRRRWHDKTSLYMFFPFCFSV